MFQTRIIDSYQLQTYEAVMDAVNQFCGAHDIVSVKNDVKKDNVIYSIVYRINTVWMLDLMNYTFRIYNRKTNDNKSRFVIDDNKNIKTVHVQKGRFFKRLNNTHKKWIFEQDNLLKNYAIKIIEAEARFNHLRE